MMTSKLALQLRSRQSEKMTKKLAIVCSKLFFTNKKKQNSCCEYYLTHIVILREIRAEDRWYMSVIQVADNRKRKSILDIFRHRHL